MSDPQARLTAEDLVPGRRYRVSFAIGTTAGWFVGEFVQLRGGTVVLDSGEITNTAHFVEITQA